MNKSPLIFVVSILTGSVFYLIVGWFIFDFILGTYTDQHTTQLDGFKKTEDFSFLFLYLSCLSYSALINFILYHTSITSLIKAFSFSGIVGILVACMTDFYWYGSSHFYADLSVVWADIVGAALSVGSLGLVSFLMLHKNTLIKSISIKKADPIESALHKD